MLRELHLDAVAVIPGAIDVSGGTAQKREQSFHADEGWDLREVLPGVFSISRADMPYAVTLGGYGYSYVAMPPTPVVESQRAINDFGDISQAAQASHNEHAAQQQYARKGKR